MRLSLVATVCQHCCMRNRPTLPPSTAAAAAEAARTGLRKRPSPSGLSGVEGVTVAGLLLAARPAAGRRLTTPQMWLKAEAGAGREAPRRAARPPRGTNPSLVWLADER